MRQQYLWRKLDATLQRAVAYFQNVKYEFGPWNYREKMSLKFYGCPWKISVMFLKDWLRGWQLWYRLWLHSLYGLYGPQCLLSPKRLLNLITHWLTPCVTMASTAMLLTVEDGHGLIYRDNDLIKQAAVFNVEKFCMMQIGVYISWYNSACKERYIHERHCDHWAE